MEVRIHSADLFGKTFNLSTEGLDEVVASYQEVWRKYGAKIISALEKESGLVFAQRYIDVYVVDRKSFVCISHPVIIGAAYSPDDFIPVLMHELIHRLLADNTLKKDFHSGENHHVPVYVLFQKVAPLISTDFYRREKNRAMKYSHYREAWLLAHEMRERNGFFGV